MCHWLGVEAAAQGVGVPLTTVLAFRLGARMGVDMFPQALTIQDIVQKENSGDTSGTVARGGEETHGAARRGPSDTT